MADTPPAPSSSPSTPPSSAAEQARLRKERREAKIKAGASARLNKIAGLGGGPRREPPQPQSPPTSHDDPEEVDISQHYYEPASNKPRPRPNNASQENFTDNQLRQMMLGFEPNSSTPVPPGATNSLAGFPGFGGMPLPPGMDGLGGNAGDDPMMKILQQMMGGVPGEGPSGMPSFPGLSPQTVDTAGSGDPYAYLWRIVHAVFALSLGLFIAFTTPFNGSRIERERTGVAFGAGDDAGLSLASVRFFWMFATAEVVLQTSRFFLEKGRVQPTGIIGMVMGFLPEPWRGYVGMVLRYARIWTTVSGDAFVCVFVLGVCAWLRGA